MESTEHRPENEGENAEGESGTENVGAAPEDVRHPEPGQSPVATDREKAVQGDPGFGEGQNPQSRGSGVDEPIATSPPPPGHQSGVPLAEDRAAGVEPGDRGPLVDPSGATSSPARVPSQGGRVAEPAEEE